LFYHTNNDEIDKRITGLTKPIEKVSNLLGKYQDVIFISPTLIISQ